jgi:filamentous hemagglutinin
VDLDILCGTDNRQCKKNDDRSLQLDDQGRIQFDPEAAKMSLEEFLTTNEGKKAIGAAGGVQGMAGSLLGVPYLPGSWLDKLVEAFSGPHDTIGSSVVGLYDDQGNATRGRSEITKTAQEVWSASGAIVLATPLATAELLPPEVWNAIAALIEAAK